MLTDQQRKQYLDIASENVSDYIDFLVRYKASNNNLLSWQDIADLVEEKYNILHSRHWYSRYYDDYIASYQGYQPQEVDEIEIDPYQEKLLNLQKEKVKISDERNQNRAYVRRLAREDTLKEIALEAVKNLSNKKLLPTYDKPLKVNNNKEAILLLSDWHYGFDFVNPWNKYNPEIAKKRISKLLSETIRFCKEQDVTNINILNLADLIAGRIHLTIRLESRIDVITQIMEVSEILAEFLNELTRYFNVNYYSCTDNHSRIEPDKTQSLDLESLCRITDWFLKWRLGNSVEFHDNQFGEDIITLNVLNHNILGVHGDRDKQNSVIEKMTLLTRKSYDLTCTAHLHHFSADEHTGTRLVSNGSLMGTDSYAKNLRLYSKPSQTLIIATPENVCDIIHIIDLDINN